jgi:hypothetical protein
MPDISTFDSRTGNLTCTSQEFFDFATNLRNIRQFVPVGSINEIHVDRESCSFQVPSLGKIDMKLSEKDPHTKVVYRGNLFQSNEFSLILSIKAGTAGNAEVILRLTAQLNPILKLMASQHIGRLLETLISEMEKFRNWSEVKE